ncbi:putative phage tail protein [Longicatena caecimuris]|uniref:putative phage tail protein n=1 Tax=Longicatena caecimuris TaxID=1796635 RepID=UPI003AB41E0E
MDRKIDLIQYLPPFMRQYLPLKLVTGAENKIFQDALSELKKIDNNEFIQTADSNGLKRFESMMGIISYHEESLDTRRNRILAKWNDELPYTINALKKKLDIVCGEHQYEIQCKFSEYQMEIVTHLKNYGQIDEFYNIVDYMIPCNILLSIINTLTNEIDMSLYVGGVVSVKSKIHMKVR